MSTLASSRSLSDAVCPFGGAVSLNAAHQGPLSASTRRAIRSALERPLLVGRLRRRGISNTHDHRTRRISSHPFDSGDDIVWRVDALRDAA